jgi:hypothetical protein
MSDHDIETVRARAKELGVTYHPAQKAETIQANIDAFLATQLPDAPKPESPAEFLKRLQADALRLIPVTVTSMDPADAGVPSVLISVGNKVLGQISKVIPFAHKWYMPKILVDELKQKMFIRNSMVPVPGGNDRLDQQWIHKYSVVEHPMPTKEELEELAKAQALGNELAK